MGRDGLENRPGRGPEGQRSSRMGNADTKSRNVRENISSRVFPGEPKRGTKPGDYTNANTKRNMRTTRPHTHQEYIFNSNTSMQREKNAAEAGGE